MSKFKIFLEPGETLEQAEDLIQKALNFQPSGDVHEEEKFHDPAIQEVSDQMQKLHADMYREMISEILQELDKEYSSGNF